MNLQSQLQSPYFREKSFDLATGEAAMTNIYDFTNRGLVVLGFPANDFLWQEPGTEVEIKSF